MVDFSKAPEGATHYLLGSAGGIGWYKVAGADVRIWFGAIWFPAKQFKDASRFTPIPT